MSSIIFVGANSEIAKASIELLDNHQKVILLTRDKNKLPDSLQKKHACYDCNPCNFDEVFNCFESICKKKEINSVVNFCGSIMLKTAAMLTLEDWQHTIDINLNTAFNVAHATTKLIQKDCQLIFFSTAAAHIGMPNHEAIAAAKAGVEGLAKSVAASYAKQNIRCNVIAPGLIQTHLTKPITNSERGKALSLSLHAIKRLGEPKDIASMLVWLLNPANNWITGEVFRIDGGLSTTKCYP